MEKVSSRSPREITLLVRIYRTFKVRKDLVGGFNLQPPIASLAGGANLCSGFDLDQLAGFHVVDVTIYGDRSGDERVGANALDVVDDGLGLMIAASGVSLKERVKSVLRRIRSRSAAHPASGCWRRQQRRDGTIDIG